MTEIKKILIFGASGFVGKEILNAFLEKEAEFSIYALENLTKVATHERLLKVKGSLFLAPQIIERIRPDIIIHAARISGQRYKYLGRKRAAIMGQLANQKILKKVLKLDIQLLYVSGSLMYGSHAKMKVNEDFVSDPISYALDYQKAERPFLKKLKTGQIMICRPGWIFGPDSWFKSFFEDIVVANKYVPQYGDGDNIMSIIHGKDLGRLIKEYALKAEYSAIYNMISPIAVTHKKFVAMLAKHFEKKINYISKKEIINKYGTIVGDALTCDINLATKYDNIINKFPYRYKSISDLLNK